MKAVISTIVQLRTNEFKIALRIEIPTGEKVAAQIMGAFTREQIMHNYKLSVEQFSELLK